MNILHWLSIFFEFVIAVLGVKIALKNNKLYGWGISLTFGIYVLYDLAKYTSVNISSDLLYLIFFIATASAFWAVWQISKEK